MLALLFAALNAAAAPAPAPAPAPSPAPAPASGGGSYGFRAQPSFYTAPLPPPLEASRREEDEALLFAMLH